MNVLLILGGSGSEYLTTSIPAHYRPDWALYLGHQAGVFVPPDIERLPNQSTIADFKRRAHYDLDAGRSIKDNMLRYLTDLVANNETTVLAGVLSRGRENGFLKRYGISATGIVRHPLHCYVSYFLNRHPAISEALGGINNPQCVEFFAKFWNEVYGDADTHIRFEFAVEDAARLDAPLCMRRSLERLDGSKRNHGVVDSSAERLLKDRVSDLYFSLYDKWDI